MSSHSPLPSLSTSPQRRPAPIMTGALPPAEVSLPERPPISPITPTEETSTSPSEQPYLAPFSTEGNGDDQPASRLPFTFAANRQGLGSPPAHATGSNSGSATPPATASASPQAPSYLTNGLVPSSSGTVAAEAIFRPQPDSLPLDKSSNADVAALKACLSVLQLQQQKARQDIATLERVKTAAVADPVGFVAELQSGQLNDGSVIEDPLAATFEHDDEASEARVNGEAQVLRTKFGALPRPQNIVRCPPINWSKYHVVGESLDRMHEEQRRRPDLGEPWKDTVREAVVFAPFSPFNDELPAQQSQGTRKAGKRP